MQNTVRRSARALTAFGLCRRPAARNCITSMLRPDRNKPTALHCVGNLSSRSMASEATHTPQPLQVPPLPPSLRRRPQRSDIGDDAAFEADEAAWLAEQKRRHEQMNERARVQDQLRDRSGRQRGTAQETDSERRVRQKREKAAERKLLEERYLQERARVQALLFTPAPAPAPAPAPSRPWNRVWSGDVPALVFDQPVPVNRDAWWRRLEKHGLTAGNLLSHNTETETLYANGRDRRHSV